MHSAVQLHLAKAQLDIQPDQQGRDVLASGSSEAAGCRQGQTFWDPGRDRLFGILSQKCSQTLEATVCCKVARCQPGSAFIPRGCWQRKSQIPTFLPLSDAALV